MSRSIIPRDLVARQLSISPQVLLRYERLGFIRLSQEGDEQGYEPAQIRRLWTILSFQRDLGINLAGVEVILRLQDQMHELHHRLHDLACSLRELVDEDDEPAAPAPTGSHRHG
jgi:MerR family transcriptional regulator/heat shock protein HspR